MREGRNVADHQPCPRGLEPRGLQVGAAIEVAIEECGSGSGSGDVDRHAVCLDEADVGVEPLVRRAGHALKQPRRRCCLDGDLQLWLFVNERANQLDAARGMAKPMAGYVIDDQAAVTTTDGPTRSERRPDDPNRRRGRTDAACSSSL